MSSTSDLPTVRTALPGPRSRELLQSRDRLGYRPLHDPHGEVPFVLAGKRDWIMEDVDGNTFVDHVSAWGATPLGASPESVLTAVEEAQRQYGMEISNYIPNVPMIELAERLLELAPAPLTRYAPSMSGTLVVEGGVKLARDATGRPMILGFLGQYHGESTYLTAAHSTDLSEVTTGSAQYVPGAVFAPYPNRFRAPFHRGAGPYDDTLVLDYVEEWLLVHQVEPDQIAGVLIEPILTEGGIMAPSDGVLGAADRALQALRLADDPGRGADRHGPLGQAVRRRAMGPRARHPAARQGVRRRRPADRCDARLREGDGGGVRRLGRHLRLGAGGVRRRVGQPRGDRDRRCPRQRG